MSASRWKRAKATVELCERRHRHRDGTLGVPGELVRWGGTRLKPRDRLRYAITISYPVEGDLYLTDVISSKPLKEGSRVTVQYDPLDPRRNSLNHPRRERKAFLIAACCVGAVLFILLVIALFGL